MRKEILSLVKQVVPFDELEANHQQSAITWIESGAGLFRTEKPATPSQHLVSYFPIIDQDYILLVEHRNAGLWLPPGGHVDPDEHPRDTVIREAREELGLDASFLSEEPLFITSTETVGLTAGHTDVSFWYVLDGDRSNDLKFDVGEFESIRWFPFDNVPSQSDPHLSRFLTKLTAHTIKPS